MDQLPSILSTAAHLLERIVLAGVSRWALACAIFSQAILYMLCTSRGAICALEYH